MSVYGCGLRGHYLEPRAASRGSASCGGAAPGLVTVAGEPRPEDSAGSRRSAIFYLLQRSPRDTTHQKKVSLSATLIESLRESRTATSPQTSSHGAD
ncbi:hypothetical protein NDU88_000416 [Pleurodeles waltl]|uniref:Uncharacterized protein n=1 Tax=Pleurodeles waltl TaxID=8319 RepID=A0AAV7US59_PLEWA|nr:hypothetical protein NDU88_000416 [Pleurodeles waltl]